MPQKTSSIEGMVLTADKIYEDRAGNLTYSVYQIFLEGQNLPFLFAGNLSALKPGERIKIEYEGNGIHLCQKVSRLEKDEYSIGMNEETVRRSIENWHKKNSKE